MPGSGFRTDDIGISDQTFLRIRPGSRGLKKNVFWGMTPCSLVKFIKVSEEPTNSISSFPKMGSECCSASSVNLH
jgi:hypothetical protein